jgi:tetratricopeptide (TPR) repeat protein
VPVVFRNPSALARALFTVIAVTAVLVTPPALAQPLWPRGPDEAKAPVTAEEFNARGRSFLEKGDDDHAAADFDKATELKPGYAAAFNNRGSVSFSRHEYARAIADFDKAIALDPRNPTFFWNRAHAYEDTGASELALGDYGQLIGLIPDDGNAMNLTRRGIAYLKKADYVRAVDDFDKSIWTGKQIENGSGDALTYTNRGYAKFFLGDFSGAAGDFSTALQFAPASEAIFWRYLARTRGGKAIAETEIAAGAASFKAGEWASSAIEFLLSRGSAEAMLSSAQNTSQRCQAQFYLAEALLLRGDRGASVEALNNTTKLCPTLRFEYVHATAELKRLDAVNQGVAASFDCSSAQTAVEQLICQDPDLAKLDREVAQKYANALARLDRLSADALRGDQRAFQLARENSPQAPDYDLGQMLQARTEMLQAIDPAPRGFFGEWLSHNGRALIRNRGGILAEFTVEPDCGFEGDGRESGKSFLVVQNANGNEAANRSLSVTRKGIAIVVREVRPRRVTIAKLPSHCSNGGSVSGTYFPVVGK